VNGGVVTKLGNAITAGSDTPIYWTSFYWEGLSLSDEHIDVDTVTVTFTRGGEPLAVTVLPGVLNFVTKNLFSRLIYKGHPKGR
jgi:hypothetical protein